MGNLLNRPFHSPHHICTSAFANFLHLPPHPRRIPHHIQKSIHQPRGIHRQFAFLRHEQPVVDHSPALSGAGRASPSCTRTSKVRWTFCLSRRFTAWKPATPPSLDAEYDARRITTRAVVPRPFAYFLSSSAHTSSHREVRQKLGCFVFARLNFEA